MKKNLFVLMGACVTFLSCNKAQLPREVAETPVKTEQSNGNLAINAAGAGLTGLVGLNDASRIVKSGSKYFWYSTGGGIRMRWTSNPQSGVWTSGPDVFPTRPAFWSTYSPQNAAWAPDVIYDAASGEYRMYYCVSSLGSLVSAIGLATNTTLDPSASGYAWVDKGIVISTNSSSTFNALDPCPVTTPGGDRYLVLGSHWSGIKLRRLGTDGKLHSSITTMWDLARQASGASSAIEAGAIYPGTKNGVAGFWLYVNWGSGLGQKENATYQVRVGWSTSITGPYLDKAGVNLYNFGGTQMMASQQTFSWDGSTRIGRGHVGIIKGENMDGIYPDWITYSYWLQNPPAGEDGKRFGMQRLIIDANGWPDDGIVFQN